MMSNCDVSVVICTRNQHSDLCETLERLAEQKSAAAWEVVVVDNASDDGSADVVAERADSYPVPLRVVVEPRPGLSRARNRGIDAARGDVLLFIDDDVSCLPGWLDAHWDAYLELDVDATGGPVHPRLPTDAPPWLVDFERGSQGGPTARYEFGDDSMPIDPGGPILLPFGCNMGIRRSRAIELGGFRSDLGWGPAMIPGEETALFRALLARGSRLWYCGGAAVEHRIKHARLDPAGFFHWYRGAGRASVRMTEPEPWPTRLIAIGGDLLRVARHAIAGWLVGPGGHGGAVHRVKRERAIGRILERIRPGGTT